MKNELMQKRRLRQVALLLSFMLLLAACGGDGGTAAPGDDEGGDAAAEGDIGEAEVDTIRVANSSTDAGSNAPFIIGQEDGTWEEEGFEVQVALVDDPRAPLVGGSADIAVIEVPYLAQAVAEGIDVVVVGGYRCREQYAFATQPDVTEVADLDGQAVNLDGPDDSPVVNFRKELLAEAGWDLDSVDVEYVTIPGSSSAWLEVFTEGQIAMTAFYRSQTGSYEDMGANIVLNEFVEWPNEVMATTREFAENNPNALARFYRGLITTTEFFMDESNKDAVVEMAVSQDYDTERLEGDYLSGPILHCPNYYVNEEVVQRQLDVQEVEGVPPFEEWSELGPLMQAQAAHGMDNEPTTPPPADS